MMVTLAACGSDEKGKDIESTKEETKSEERTETAEYETKEESLMNRVFFKDMKAIEYQ